MLAFDAAPRETCVVREIRTNTPIQALNLMNDPTYGEAARLYAERMLREGGESDEQRLEYGFLLVTARPPSGREAAIPPVRAESLPRPLQTPSPKNAELYLATGEHPRDGWLAPAELAAYTAVASMLLNLDETVTRE